MSRAPTDNHGDAVRIVTLLRQRLEKLKRAAHVVVQTSCGDPDEIIDYRGSRAPKREMSALVALRG